MQTSHYPPAETYCCWDVMVISRCPQTIITVATFFIAFPLFFGVFLLSLSVFFVPWNIYRFTQKNISVIPFFPSSPVIPFTCFPSLLVIFPYDYFNNIFLNSQGFLIWLCLYLKLKLFYKWEKSQLSIIIIICPAFTSVGFAIL